MHFGSYNYTVPSVRVTLPLFKNVAILNYMFDRIRFVDPTPIYPNGVVVFDETDIISSYVLRGLEWEPDICELMAQQYEPGTDVLDIGANLGLNSISMHKRVPITGTLHLFEPQPDVFTMMKHNTRHIPSRKLYNMCLGSHASVLQFEQYHVNVGGTFMFGEGGCRNDLKIYPMTQNNMVSVAAVGLDMIDLCVDRKISLVKMDVEGSEYNVLKGARKTLQYYKPTLLIEIWSRNSEPVFEMLRSIGYSNIQHIYGEDYLCKF